MLYQYSLPEFQCIYKGGAKGGAEDEFQIFPRFVKQSLTIYIFGDILHSLLKVLHWMIPTIFLLKKNRITDLC